MVIYLLRRILGQWANYRKSVKIFVLSAGFCACTVFSQSPLYAGDNTPDLPNRFPRMVHEYFVQQLKKIEEKANERRSAIKTTDEAEAYIQNLREKIQLSFGPWPEKTPLNPRIIKVIEHDTYRIENIIFESRPQFLVTANLYIPKGRNFPLPGVIGTMGHSKNGKASRLYQSFAQGLVKQGYVVLNYDPIGQGERLQYPDENLKSKVGGPVAEHLYAGNQQFLVGEFFGSWRAWDGIRALDYLLSRKEVDPNKIGITGNSGGGTMTTWLCGLERRFTMGAPSCFVTTFRRNLENELPADTEQYPPNILKFGIDEYDFLAAMAPKPIIILAKERDFFDIRGTETAYKQLRSLYGKLGAEENIQLFVGEGYHGYRQDNREAMYRFFNNITGVSDSKKEPEITIEEDETIWCASDGQVSELNSRSVYSFTREKSIKLSEEREKNIPEEKLKQKITGLLHLEKFFEPKENNTPPDYRIMKSSYNRSFNKPNLYPERFSIYFVETEPGIFAIVYRLSAERLMSRPPKEKKRAVLYIAHHSSDEELREEPLVAELISKEPNSVFYMCDIRGIGESKPNTCHPNSFLEPYGSDFFYAGHSIMLGKSYVGQKTFDIMRVIEWLKQFEHKEVHLVGKGWGSIPVTFAAVLSDQVKQVTLKNALISYSAIAESETYSWPLSCFVPNILKFFDLPDCYKILKKKNLHMIETCDANGEVITNQ